MRLKTATAVAAGAFNPAIVVPPWMQSQGLLEPGEVASEHSLSAAGVAVRHRMHNFVWAVTHDRFVIDRENAEGAEDAPANLLSDVLTRLPHTPVRAIGNNFTFEESNGAPWIGRVAVDGRSTEQLIRSFGADPAAAEVKLLFADRRNVQVQLTITGHADSPGCQLAFNFHRAVSSVETATEALGFARADVEAAHAIAASFEVHR